MIDIAQEHVVSLIEAARQLPKRRKRKRPNVATLYRWSQKGVRGIVLETIQVGGTRCTSLEALQRFCNRLTDPEAPAPVTRKARKQSVKRAERKLARAGI